jgi:hypothetical protein
MPRPTAKLLRERRGVIAGAIKRKLTAGLEAIKRRPLSIPTGRLGAEIGKSS